MTMIAKDERRLFGMPDFGLTSVNMQDWFEDSILHLTNPDLTDIEVAFPQSNDVRDDGLPMTFFSFEEQLPTESSKRRKTATIINDRFATLPNAAADASDLWQLPIAEEVPTTKYQSWESFHQSSGIALSGCYLTEAGPRVLDAVLAEKEDVFGMGEQDYQIIDMPTYVSALLSMGLGRSSALFPFDDKKQYFVQSRSNVRVTGCTGVMTTSVRDIFMRGGNTFRSLQKFIMKTYARQESPAKIALADAASILLQNVQASFVINQSQRHTLLQVETAFKPVEKLLAVFADLVKMAIVAKTDEALLSELYSSIMLLEHQSDPACDVYCEVLSHISRQFLDFAGEWLGIQREQNNMRMELGAPNRNFVKTERVMKVDEQGLDNFTTAFVMASERIPSFVSPRETAVLFETGKSLRFIRTHHVAHPLSQASLTQLVNAPKLQWQFSWQEIEDVAAKATQYEKDLVHAIQQYALPEVSHDPSTSEGSEDVGMFDIFGRTEDEIEASFLKSMQAVHQRLPELVPSNRLSDLIRKRISTTETGSGIREAMPPLTLIPELSFYPIIAAQARVVNGVSMRLFFKDHKLLENLSIQRRFQLMGDGVYTSSLSHALFNPELETAERKTGVARSGAIMGLRLGGRENWPPATSELRLSLMGILHESYAYDQSHNLQSTDGITNTSSKSRLPGDLSFAVREMSDDEIQACMNPHSVQALDFLRLSYKPPVPLEAVITSESLFKYDQLFKLLLRVLRMVFCVNQLFRDITSRTSKLHPTSPYFTQFRIEAHFFINSINSYLHESINETWHIFQRKLRRVEAKLEENGGFPILGPREGIDGLRIYHERVLDTILFSLFLRKRQSAIMKLIEDIFTSILGFARITRLRAVGAEDAGDERIAELYDTFRKKMATFMVVCRTLIDKGQSQRLDDASIAASGEEGGDLFDCADLEQENQIAKLLVKLELSGYY